MLQVALALLLFLLTACSRSREAPLYELQLTKESLNGLNKTTPFSTQAIAPLFPGFEMQTFQSVTPEKSTLLRLYYCGEEWFQIESTEDKKRIKSLYILSDKIEHTCHINSDEMCKNSDTLHYFYDKRGYLQAIELIFSI